jgi:hypothetical protein
LRYTKLIINRYKIFFDLINQRKTLDIFKKINKIENIFILISIIPFLKKEIFVTKNNPIFGFFINIFNWKGNHIIKFSKDNKTYIASKFRDLLYYKWESLPNKNETNYIRHILYNYYPENCLSIYEESLNLNIENYIVNNNVKLSYDSVNDLISKNLKDIIFR